MEQLVRQTMKQKHRFTSNTEILRKSKIGLNLQNLELQQQLVTEAACEDGEMFTITDAAGVTTTYRISKGLHYLASGTNAASYVAGGTDGRGTAGTITIGIAGRTTVEEVRDEIIIRINAGSNTEFSAEDSSASTITITQTIAGPLGNKENENLPSPSTGLFALGIGNFTGGIGPTPKRHDNMHFNTPIPASDFQYSWINAAISGSNWEENQNILTHAPKSGLVGTATGYAEAIVFPTISEVVCDEGCDEDSSITITVTYDVNPAEESDPDTISITSSTSLNVTISDTATEGNIWQDDIDKIDFSAVYSGCCETGLQYRITAEDGSGRVEDTGYSFAPPAQTWNIIRDTGEAPGNIDLTFYVKDCEENVETLVVTLQKAEFDP
jgi:hypothetical protein